MPPLAVSGVANAVRIRASWYVGLEVLPYVTGRSVGADFHVEYDDGGHDVINCPELPTTAGTPTLVRGAIPVPKSGWIVGLTSHDSASGTPPNHWAVLQYVISPDADFNRALVIAVGEGTGPDGFVQPGTFLPQVGPTWVFQGTVASDATAGTHVCSLTVTPGAGNEMELRSFQVIQGANAGAQTMDAAILDGVGGNIIDDLFNRQSGAATTGSSANIQGPIATAGVTVANMNFLSHAGIHKTISGTMALQLRVSTAVVSLTQTFAVACRLRGRGVLPTATLADTVGAPTLTTNTNAVF